MKLKKKILSIITTFAILIIAILPVNGATNIDLAAKLNVLNKLTIIKDNPLTYKSSLALKRWEAAVYLVRILGKEAEVTANTETLKVTSFSDVKSSDFFAPYIGYCAKNGLANGGSGGKFGPNDNISEKAFLTIALRALGYQSDKDFSSFAVFSTAYLVGLVTDKSYETRETDSATFLRKDAINVLYNMLNIKLKDSKILIIQNLVTAGVTTKEKAHTLGVLKDMVETAFGVITSIDGNRVHIAVNENFKQIKDSDIEIYETANPLNKLTTKIEVQANSAILVITSNQMPNMNYTINIRNITDIDGNIKDIITSTFSGNKDAEIKSDFFKISKVVNEDRNNINVYFTHPINSNSELPRYYEIYEGANLLVKGSFDTLYVTCLPTGNGINIKLKNIILVEGTEYTVKISGDLRSIYGVKLNNGLGDNFVFKGTGSNVNELGLMIIDIVALDSKTLEVTFSKELDTFYAKQFLNYSVITDTNSIIAVNKVALSQDAGTKNRVIRLSLLEPMVQSKTYMLSINFLQDSLKQLTISEEKKQFTPSFTVSNDFIITTVSAIDKSTITISVNKPLDAKASSNPEFYSVYAANASSSLITPVKVTYHAAPGNNTVKLYLPLNKPLSSGIIYRVRLTKDLQFNPTPISAAFIEYSFTGSSGLINKPEINEAIIISQDTVLVRLTKEIAAEAPNILTSNYSLEYKDTGYSVSKIPLSVTYIDEKTLILRFDDLTIDTEYTLKYGNLKDFNNSMTTDAYLTNSIKVLAGK
jgi:hypothetical protein